MNKKIIDKMIQSTLYDILNDEKIVNNIFETNKDKFRVYANEYLLRVTLSNEVVKIVFKLNEIDELSNVSIDELNEFVETPEQVTTFKEYILQKAMLESEANDFLDRASVEKKYGEESLLEEQRSITNKLDDISLMLSKIAVSSLQKPENSIKAINGTIDLKQLLAEMLKDVVLTESEDVERLIENFIDFNDDEGSRIEKDEKFDITNSVRVEERDIEPEVNEDFDAEEDEVEFDLSEEFESEEDELEPDLNEEFGSDEDELEPDLNEEFESDEDELDLNESNSSEETELENELEDLISGLGDDDDSGAEEDVKPEVELLDDEFDSDSNDVDTVDYAEDSNGEYDEKKFYKIKDDDELQKILQVRRVKNIILFIAMFAAFALATLLIIF